MEYIIGLLVGFGIGTTVTVYLAHMDCRDGLMRTPFADYQCSETPRTH